MNIVLQTLMESHSAIESLSNTTPVFAFDQGLVGRHPKE